MTKSKSTMAQQIAQAAIAFDAAGGMHGDVQKRDVVPNRAAFANRKPPRRGRARIETTQSRPH